MRALVGLATALLCALALGVFAQAAGAPVIPIAGIAGGDVRVVATLRTADGGAILLARVASSPGDAQGRVIVARLEADGSLDLAYGDAGLVTLPVGAGALPTALAVEPARGDAWIGLSTGHSGAGMIVALDTHGRPASAFGAHGILTLAGGDAGGPLALDWRANRLLLAAGTSPCRGCRLSVRDAIRGTALRTATLARGALGPPGCSTAVGGAVFTAADRETVTTDATGDGCASVILTLGPALEPLGRGAAVAGARTSLATAGGGSSWGCLATAGPGGVRISAYAGSRTSAPAAAPPGTVLALAPIAEGACAALIGERGGGIVAQMAAGDRRTLTDRVPAGVAPAALFRCHQHLLVVGTAGAAGHRSAVVLPVTVRRGAASIAVSTGCR